MRISVRTLTNRTVDIDVEPNVTVGAVLQRASDVETCSWRPGEYHKDVVLVHRRTFRRFSDVEQTLVDCGIKDGDILELTKGFAMQPVATKLLEPVGFYDVFPKPASAGVPLRSDISIHLVNIIVEGRPCIVVRADGDMDEEAVQCVQLWQPPNVLKLVPSVALRPDTLYSVTLDLNLDSPGIRVINHDGYDISCVADGVDTVRPFLFVWHFTTTASDGLSPAGPGEQYPVESLAGDCELPMLDVVHGLLSRPLDGFSKKQLLALQADLGCMLDRVGHAIAHIDQKIDTINRRLQEKSRRLSGADSASIENALKRIRHVT